MGDRKLTFGKYKGWKVSDLIISNPEYVKWIDKNVPYFNTTADEKRILYRDERLNKNKVTNIL